jgi:uncharacterized protein YoxC
MKQQNKFQLLNAIIFVALFIVIFALLMFIKDLEFKINSMQIESNKTIMKLNQTIESMSNDLAWLGKKFDEIVVRQENLVNRVNTIESNLQQANQMIEELKSQKGLINPTYFELAQFVAEDTTNTLQYVNNTFNCVDFSNTFISNFAKKGYYSCLTEIVFSNDTAHALVAVNTTDKGLLYVEPQSDIIITSLKVGDDYCAKVGWNCDWVIKYLKSCYDIRR